MIMRLRDESTLDVVDYSQFSDEQLLSRIADYKSRHGSLEAFSEKIGEPPMQDNHEIKEDWRYLIMELQERQLKE